MGTLERVLEMQKSGASDSQITQTLLQEKVSPKEILDALSQSKIKSAVAVEEQANEMQPSIMSASEATPSPSAQNSVPSYPPQGQYQEQQYSSQPQYAPQQEYASQPEQYPVQQQYQEQQYSGDQTQYAQQPDQQYQQGYGLDLETIRDISRREVESNTIKMKQQTDLLVKTIQELKTQMQILSTRTAKAESSINELQSAIIRKIGEYGEAISTISQEMKETQKSFSKMINPILDKKHGVSNEQAEEAQEQTSQDSSRRSRQNSPGFEGFLR